MQFDTGEKKHCCSNICLLLLPCGCCSVIMKECYALCSTTCIINFTIPYTYLVGCSSPSTSRHSEGVVSKTCFDDRNIGTLLLFLCKAC